VLYSCVQAAVYCTPGKAKKVVIGLTVVALISTAIIILVEHLASFHELSHIYLNIYAVVFLVLPSAVLVINLLVAHEVRRAYNTASTTLGRRQSQQATSSNSAVPTVMLISTSLIYVFLSGTWSIVQIFFFRNSQSEEIEDTSLTILYFVAIVLNRLIFVYNFFVYLITGRQFRSELRSLCCCCCCTPATAVANDAAVSRGRQLSTIVSSV